MRTIFLMARFLKTVLLITALLGSAACAQTQTSNIVTVKQPPPHIGIEPLLEVNFISVGVGDAILLRSQGETMLVDGGYHTSAGRLKNFMRKQSLASVTSLLNTHLHDDHIEGMILLLRSGFTAESFFCPYYRDIKPRTYRLLYPELESKHIAYRTLGQGNVLTLGAATLYVYRDPDVTHDANARSLVLKVVCGNRSLLLMADVTGLGQKSLMRAAKEELHADVLKVPHHGITPCVSGFLEMVAPEAAIITNQRSSVSTLEAQLNAHDISSYYTCTRDVYLATEGETWYIYQ